MRQPQTTQARWNVTLKGSLILVPGDITTAAVEALVNAANSQLAGGGVDGAIHAAAGPELLDACRAIIQTRGSLETGQAVLTPGFKLHARHVIHTVGPIWRNGSHNEETLLRAAYENSLSLAQAYGLRSLAFPAISCGAYGYPLELAAQVALGALRNGLEKEIVDTIFFYHFGATNYTTWRALAARHLGAPKA